MLADEHAVRKACRQRIANRGCQAQRRRMRAQGIVRHDRARDELRPLRLDTGIHMLTKITIGPSVKTTVSDGGHVIRHQVTAQLIALVHHCPECARVRFPRQAVWIA